MGQRDDSSWSGVRREGDVIRGGINVQVDLPRVVSGRQMYRVRVERTTIMETDLEGTPVEVIEAAKLEANGNSIVSDERVSVWIPGEEVEPEPKPWGAYDQSDDDLKALSDEESHDFESLFPDSH